MSESPHVSGNGRFAGKVILITGAASGLGRSLALGFARAGSDLVLVDVNEEGLRQTASLVEAQDRQALVKRVDVSSWAEMSEMAREVLSEWGRVDILVNNAGVFVGGELKDVPIEDIEWITGINLMGEIYGTRLFLPQMVERKEGHIVNVASLSALVVLPWHLPYTTTKFGLGGFSEALWAEARPHGIGVTLVCPGGMKTNIAKNTRVYTTTSNQKKFEEWFGDLISNKMMEPDKAAAIVMRAVERNRFLVLLGSEAYLMYYFRRFFPGLARRLVATISAWGSKG
jgi:short-subunit dehydrogenase